MTSSGHLSKELKYVPKSFIRLDPVLICQKIEQTNVMKAFPNLIIQLKNTNIF